MDIKDFDIGDIVQVQSGSKKGHVGEITEINKENVSVKINFGNVCNGYETPKNLKIWASF